ncbi:hypothetical protein cyc_07809 [Cyclospora cayetanensis]|uniref:PhoD-like phosphatase metallophosphatase domain-containing protein n=1 Tax=Cyclospora cayetanensis TaxID=88456 RepID=A0A1D3DAQ4_9EIME|nr:hypothetical protein cyc_07809 [Cyclospora cayetanensis]
MTSGALRLYGLLDLRSRCGNSLCIAGIARLVSLVAWVSLFSTNLVTSESPLNSAIGEGHSSGPANEGSSHTSHMEENASWDMNYVFKPSPVFWKPLASLPAPSFPPYDLGHHAEPPHRLIFASSDHMQLPTANDSRNFLWKLSEGKKPIPPPGLLAAYKSQLEAKEYREFLKEVPRIAGTWDDHDMGEDNANKMYLFKDESKEAMLNFLGVDEAAAIRSLEWRGVYSSHDTVFGEDLRVKVIFLDLRFEKDSWWLMDLGDMLGEQQWDWLTQELQSSSADINVVVSSLQTFANHRVVTEAWSHFPWARERLFALLAGSGAKTPIILSGDSHYAEFGAVHCQRLRDAWCLNEPEARSYYNILHNRTTGQLTPHQQLRRLADSDDDEMSLGQDHDQTAISCHPSDQCCSLPPTQSFLFWWVPRHLPFFLMALFRAATNSDAFAPRQGWRRSRAPAFSGAFPAPPFVPDQPHQKELSGEDPSSTYLFDMTSSGLGNGVPESMCLAASAVVDLVAYFLSEGLPFASPLNADITGPRLLYTERNFGELQFIENPLQLVLFPPNDDGTPAAVQQQELMQRKCRDNSTCSIQLLRVREKQEALLEMARNMQKGRSLERDRTLTKKQAAEFRSRLRAYKRQRQLLIDQLRDEPVHQLPVLERLVAQSKRFSVYVEAMMGSYDVFFMRLLKLHSAMLLAHMCEDEGSGQGSPTQKPDGRQLFETCSLLAHWAATPLEPRPQSVIDKGLRWLWDLFFGLTARRITFFDSLPLGDAATLRLSAATDQLTRSSAAARAAGLARAAIAKRSFTGRLGCKRLLGRRSLCRVTQRPHEERLILRGVFAAVSDGLLRQACMQLQSPRRQQQREELNQLFERGVASQPADPFAFGKLDPNLHQICSLVDVPSSRRPFNEPTTYPVLSEAAITLESRAARAVGGSWVLVELLETKSWVLTRTFEVVTGRLVMEKLLSTFASEQRAQRPGIGQWACQGWKGPTESRMYLYHMYILLAVRDELADTSSWGNFDWSGTATGNALLYWFCTLAWTVTDNGV